jgi:hypothetical protein
MDRIKQLKFRMLFSFIQQKGVSETYIKNKDQYRSRMIEFWVLSFNFSAI